MPSLSKMENPAKFPLLHLPRLAIDEVISMMVPVELIYFSKISPRTEMIVKTLPARKRTYEVVLKIASSYGVTIHRSKMNWELASTQDFSLNYGINAYSRDFQLHHIKEIYECINRILNFSYKTVVYHLGPLISDHKSMIDWLKSQQESVEELDIVSQASFDNELEYLLSTMKASKCLSLTALNGISLQQLLRMNCPRITLRNTSLTGSEINLFLKSWMASESNLNLEYFQVYIENEETMNTILDLPHERDVRYENTKFFGNDKVGVAQVFAGIEIKQSSGKTGVMGTARDGVRIYLVLYIF